MPGFNVETYQISKQDANIASGGVSQDLLDRISTLEANQMNIYNTFTYDFQSKKYTDEYKSTTITTNNGIIPRQFLNNNYIGFTTDDIVDYDTSDDIKWATDKITLDLTSTLNGTLRLLPIDMNGAVGMKFHCNYTNKLTAGSTAPAEIKTQNLWFISEVDKNGRLWVISSEQFSTGVANFAHVNIYNTDNTVYKSFDIANKVLFGQVDATAAYPMFGAGNMKFTDENVAVIVTRTHPSSRNGGFVEADDFTVQIDKVVLLNDAGQYNVLGAYSGYWVYVNGNYLFSYTGSTQAEICINDDIIYIQFGSYTTMMTNNASYLDNRYRNYAAYRITGSLTTLTNIELIKSLTRGGLPRTTGTEPVNGRYTAFWNSNVMYDEKEYYNCIGTSKGLIWDSNYINQLYSLQVGVNEVDKTFNSEASTTDINYTVLNAATNKIVIYGHPGFNGMFQASNGKFYIFGNDTTSKTAILNCYIPDWANRKTGKLNVVNSITKTLSLQTCSMSVHASALGYMPTATYPNANSYSNWMKVIEHDNQLHLFYMAPLSDTVRRLCLKYMSFDMNLNQVIEETVLYQQESDTVRLNDFNVEIFNNEILVVYSVGNREDFTASNNDSKLYSINITKVSSSIDFYYLDDTERIWRPINDGDEVLFNHAVNNVTLRAYLTSSTYNASPVINSFSLESWNNNGQQSRQSEYYSTQIETVQNDGKGTLTADCDSNDGTIDWYISFDGGKNYVSTNLDEEFVYNQIQAPDFRVKAVLSVTDNAINLPVIHSYTLTTSHVVLHSDLEEVQINLIKTNFKIDTFTNASKNGLLKMTIDTLSNGTNIDAANSNCIYYQATGRAGGNYIQTIPEAIPEGIKTLLLTTEEYLDETKPDSKILYYVSIDNGATWKSIIPNIKLQVSNTNTANDTLVMKAVFYDNAYLSAWGWAWN